MTRQHVQFGWLFVCVAAFVFLVVGWEDEEQACRAAGGELCQSIARVIVVAATVVTPAWIAGAVVIGLVSWSIRRWRTTPAIVALAIALLVLGGALAFVAWGVWSIRD